MPRPIVLTEDIKKKARDDFAAMLDGLKMSGGKLSYSQSWEYKECSAIVWIKPLAYRKIVALVMDFKDEVGWHGSAYRTGNNEFVIDDIFVYPQEVTGSTVNTDQAAYTEWLYGLDDETFNAIRMQGHSHVNMGVSPSGVDDKHRQQILDQLEPDMFYIFMIWNKSLSTHTLIYDMASNILYEDKDVEIRLVEDEGMGEFLEDVKVKVQKRANSISKTSTSSKTYLINKKGKGSSKTSKKQISGQVTALGGQVAALGIDDAFEDFEMLYDMQDFYDFSLSDAKHLAGEYDQGGRKWRR